MSPAQVGGRLRKGVRPWPRASVRTCSGEGHTHGLCFLLGDFSVEEKKEKERPRGGGRGGAGRGRQGGSRTLELHSPLAGAGWWGEPLASQGK